MSENLCLFPQSAWESVLIAASLCAVLRFAEELAEYQKRTFMESDE